MQAAEYLSPNQPSETAYDDLVVSVEASENTLSLLLAVCDNFQLREEIIRRYEKELSPEIQNYRVTLPKEEPSLKQAIAQTIEKNSYLKRGGKAVFTVVGAEQLQQLRYGAERSEQEIFLGYLQWTREGLQEFQYPIILWLTNQLLGDVSRKARDFWSWRKDVFRFVSPTKPSSIPNNLPYRGNVMFVGRESELQALHQQLQASSDQLKVGSIFAIAGMGGIGKTELALEYAARYVDAYPGGICWLRAREDVGIQIVSFARHFLGLEPPLELDIATQVAWCWQHWQAGQILVIFDDTQSYEEIRPFLPPQELRFKALLTTRLQVSSPVRNLQLDVLSEATALELLRSLLDRDRPDLRGFQNLGGLETAKRLCEWLGYLPLGVELVGRYLARKPDLSLAVLWQRLQDKRLDAIAFKQTEPGMTASLGMAAAFELSWQALDKSAQQVAVVLSLFALVEIPWTLVEQCLPTLDAEELEEIRDEQLLGTHLLKRVDQGLYQLHQLLREFFAAKREQMVDVDAMKQTFCQAMVAVGEQVPRTPTLSLIEQITPAIPHLKEAATTFARWLTDADLITPSTRIGWFYEGQAAYSEAEGWYEQCRSLATQRLGTDHPAVATSLNNLAHLYYVQGRYQEAEPLFLRALAILEQHLGADYLDVATTLKNLANLYRVQGRYQEAEPLFLRALTISEQHLGADHPDVIITLENLANLYRAQGRYQEVEPLVLRALAIGEQKLGEDHATVPITLNNLAELYRVQERYQEAELLFLQALATSEQQLGEDHPIVAVTLDNVAELYHSQGRYQEAEPLYLRALAISEQHLGADHPAVAIRLNNVAELYQSQGRYQEAEPLYTRALNIRELQLGADHPFVADSLNKLAALYELQRRYTEAEPLYQRALLILVNRLGPNHPNTRRTHSNLAALYDAMAADFKLQGRYEQVAAYLEKAITLRSQLLQ